MNNQHPNKAATVHLAPPTFDQLQQKIRRSSNYKDKSIVQQFLTYASMVRDEDEIYSFMEENSIGVSEPEFWAAKLAMLKNRCQYREFIKVAKNLNRNQKLKKYLFHIVVSRHPKYWLITEVQNQLERYLEKLLRKKIKNRTKGKRSAKQYEILNNNYHNIQKQTRKFGNIQVYVDPDCRLQYRLQDLIDFITPDPQVNPSKKPIPSQQPCTCYRKQLIQQCMIQKNFYERELINRPVSFLGKAKDRIDKMSREALGLALSQEKNKDKVGDKNSKNVDGLKRRSGYENVFGEFRRSARNRLSFVGRSSNKMNINQQGIANGQKQPIMLTPDFKKQRKSQDKSTIYNNSLLHINKQLRKNKRNKKHQSSDKSQLDLTDSVQILKNIHYSCRKSQSCASRCCSRKELELDGHNPEFDRISNISSVKKSNKSQRQRQKQAIRASPKKSSNHSPEHSPHHNQLQQKQPHQININQVLSQPDLHPDNQHQSVFSFGDESRKYILDGHANSQTQQLQRNTGYWKSFGRVSRGKRYDCVREAREARKDDSRDFAFIQYQQTLENTNKTASNLNRHPSYPLIPNPNALKQPTSLSIDLQNVIKQIQMQKYQSQTMSQIDSNKQNNQLGFTGYSQESLHESFEYSIERDVWQKQRKKFQTIKKQNPNPKLPPKPPHRPHQQTPNDQSSQLVYKQLLYYLQNQNDLGEKPITTANNNNLQIDSRHSMSERDRKKIKRISRISEERSYSFSETRPRSRSGNT